MRFVARSDLGGYGTKAPAVEAVAGIEVDRPFVLLTGPNGSGKTALLRMARAAMGLTGERAGRTEAGEMERDPSLKACGGDLGKLAAFKEGFGGHGLKNGIPGVLDVRALEWSGQRSWLFDSRTETGLASAGSFDRDITYHASRLLGTGSKSSHGQFLGGGWAWSIRWALGLIEAEDPYDGRGVDPARRALFKAVCPDGARPAERWLFLDEPETALDAENLMAGLCALVGAAEIGRLRVFCASHAPVFAAGLGLHPSVQIIDMAKGGNWFEVQRRALAIAADPGAVGDVGARVVADLVRAHRSAEDKAARETARKVSAAIRGLGPAPLALLDALLARKGHVATADDPVPGLEDERARSALVRRDLAESRGSPRTRRIELTRLGIEVGRARRDKVGAASVKAPRKRALKPAAKPSETSA